MQRPTFTATAVMNARRNSEAGNMELNLIDAKGNTQNLVLDNVAVGHVLTAILQKTSSDGKPPAFYLNESIPLHTLAPFRLPTHAGLRMFIDPVSVIDFVFDPQHVATLKQMIDDLAAQPAPPMPSAQ